MVATTDLQRIKLRGWRSGFTNLLRKENYVWWRTRRWWMQSILWTIILDGLLALVLYALPIAVAMDPAQDPEAMDFAKMGLQTIFQLGPLFLAACVIVVGQDLILGERESGVAEWILTKPVAPTAYVLAKLLAGVAGILVTMIAVPYSIAYALLLLTDGGPVPLITYLVGILGLALYVLFYFTLTLMLGVYTTHRGKLLGVALGTLLGGLVLPGVVGRLALVTPWVLPNLLPAMLAGETLPVPIILPIGTTCFWCVLFVGGTLWRFNRSEF